MKDNFDDILRRKLAEQHFPVDDIHRQEMIELLNGKKRRGILPIWWLGSLVIVASLAGYFFVTEQENFQPSSPMQQEEIREITPATENQQAPSIANVQSPQNSVVSSDPINSSTINSSTINSSTVNSSSTVNTKSTSPKAPGSTMPSGPSDKVLNASPDAPTTYLVEGEALTSYVIVTQSAAVTIEDPDAYLQTDPEVKLESENGLLAFTQERVTRHTTFVDPLEMMGVEYASHNGMTMIKPRTSFRKLFYLFGEAGVGMVLPSLPAYSTGWKFRGGAGLGYRLSPKVQLSWSAGYLLQTGGFDFERTSTVNQPSFGTRSSFNTLTPDKLHFVYSRIGMQYRLHRHQFGVHGGMQWLYGAQGTIVTQVQDQFVSGASETTTYVWVKTDGLRQLHWTGDVSYGYQLTPRLVATVGTDFYFSTITVTDAALAADGYYWDGAFASLHPFITLNYLLYGR